MCQIRDLHGVRWDSNGSLWSGPIREQEGGA